MVSKTSFAELKIKFSLFRWTLSMSIQKHYCTSHVWENYRTANNQHRTLSKNIIVFPTSFSFFCFILYTYETLSYFLLQKIISYFRRSGIIVLSISYFQYRTHWFCNDWQNFIISYLLLILCLGLYEKQQKTYCRIPCLTILQIQNTERCNYPLTNHQDILFPNMYKQEIEFNNMQEIRQTILMGTGEKVHIKFCKKIFPTRWE